MVRATNSQPRLRFTIGQVMLFIAALALLLAAVVVRHSVLLALIAFFVATQLLLRLLIVVMPSLGSIFLGIGQRTLTEEDAAEFREKTRAAVKLYLAGEYSKALQVLLEAEAIRSGDVANALGQALCLRRLGRINESPGPLERARIHTPFEPLLHYALACHWSLAGQSPRALDSLSMALELDPDLRDCAADEPDFNAIRGEDDYARLIDGTDATP